MTWPTIFGNLAAGNQQLSLFDAMFTQVAIMSAIPCSASGTNAIVLTQLGNAPTVASYQNFQMFRFKPAATTTGAVTIQFTGLGALPAFKKDGTSQMAANDLVAGQEYMAVFDSTRNAGNGGFFIEDASQLPQSPAQTIRGNNLLVPGNTVDLTQSQARATIYSPPYDAFASNNLAINSGTTISQVNGVNGITIGTGTFGYICDQFLASFVNAVGVLTGNPIQTYVPQNAWINSVNMRSTTGLGALAAGDYIYLAQPIEAQRMAKLGFGFPGAFPISIGFWVSTSIAGTMTVALQNFAHTRTYLTNLSITTGATWQYLTVTIPGDVTGAWTQDNNAGLWIYFCFGAGSTNQGTNNSWQTGNFLGTSSTTNFFVSNGNTANLTGLFVVPGVDLPGSVASALTQRDFITDLALCQRYYEKSYDIPTPVGAVSAFNGSSVGRLSGLPNASYTINISVPLKVTKRAVPGITIYSPNTGAAGKTFDGTASADVNATTGFIGTNGFVWAATNNAAQTGYLLESQWSADARM